MLHMNITKNVVKAYSLQDPKMGSSLLRSDTGCIRTVLLTRVDKFIYSCHFGNIANDLTVCTSNQ